MQTLSCPQLRSYRRVKAVFPPAHTPKDVTKTPKNKGQYQSTLSFPKAFEYQYHSLPKYTGATLQVSKWSPKISDTGEHCIKHRKME